MSSGGGASSGGNQTTTSQVVVPPWVQTQLQQNIGQANQLAAQPYQQYPGPTVAGFTPDQTASFQAIENMQGVAPAQIGQAYNEVANLPQTTQSLLTPYMSTVGGDVSRAMGQVAGAASSDLANNAPATSAFGGNANQVQQNTINTETTRNVGQVMNAVANQGWGTAMNTALNQASTMGTLAGAEETAGLTGANALNQVGSAQQTLQQAQYANALQQWQMAQNYPYQQLAIAQSALAGSPYGATVTSAQPYTSNSAAQWLGGIASAVPVLGNIQNVGTSFSNAFNSIFG